MNVSKTVCGVRFLGLDASRWPPCAMSLVQGQPCRFRLLRHAIVVTLAASCRNGRGDGELRGRRRGFCAVWTGRVLNRRARRQSGAVCVDAAHNSPRSTEHLRRALPPQAFRKLLLPFDAGTFEYVSPTISVEMKCRSPLIRSAPSQIEFFHNLPRMNLETGRRYRNGEIVIGGEESRP
jgi:hypothetical protein